MDAKRVANNILEFLLDPTVFPVRERLYFRPEEILQNESYEGAKEDAQKAYGDQKHNSDFYPLRNRQQQTGKFSNERKELLMDRRTLIASLDILSQNFKEEDPIGKDLRTMAYALSQETDEDVEKRLSSMTVEAKKKMKFVTCPKCGNKKVICMKCKGEGTKEATEEVPEEASVEASVEKPVEDFWTKEASEAVARALVSDVLGTSCQEEEEEEDDAAATAAAVKTAMDQHERAMKNWPAGGKAAPTEKAPAEEAPAEEAVPEEKPAKKAPAKEPEKEVPAEEGKEEAEVEAKKEEKDQPEPKAPEAKVVDTSVLSKELFAGIEMESNMVEADLTEEDKSRLDLLFK